MTVKEILKVAQVKNFRIWKKVDDSIGDILEEHFISLHATDMELNEISGLHDFVYSLKTDLPEELQNKKVRYIDCWDENTLHIRVED